jgi:very-short-patch-repair endonuclease
VLFGYIADIYSSGLKLIVEVDGSSHIGKEEYDTRRDSVFSRNGIKTIRTKDSQVKSDLKSVVDRIVHLGKL